MSDREKDLEAIGKLSAPPPSPEPEPQGDLMGLVSVVRVSVDRGVSGGR